MHKRVRACTLPLPLTRILSLASSIKIERACVPAVTLSLSLVSPESLRCGIAAQRAKEHRSRDDRQKEKQLAEDEKKKKNERER